MRCLVCNKEVSEVRLSGDRGASVTYWDGGVVEWISVGYGSQHDLSRLRICLCDDCITDKVAVGVVQETGPYKDFEGIDDAST